MQDPASLSLASPLRPCLLGVLPCSSLSEQDDGRTPVEIWYSVSTMPASRSTIVIVGLTRAAVAQVRNNCVNVSSMNV